MMTISMHPALAISVAAVVAAAACVYAARVASRKATQIIWASAVLMFLLVPAWVVVALRPEIVDGRYKTYKRLYRDIHVSMTRLEVFKLVAHHYPVGGKRLSPIILANSKDALVFFMNPEGSPEPNCEGIFLEMANDKVLRKSYSPD